MGFWLCCFAQWRDGCAARRAGSAAASAAFATRRAGSAAAIADFGLAASASLGIATADSGLAGSELASGRLGRLASTEHSKRTGG